VFYCRFKAKCFVFIAIKCRGDELKTKIVTRSGYNKLKEEHDYLWTKKRPEITKIVTWAASLGDRSENADYQYNKRLLRQIDRRVRFLRKYLPEVVVVDYSPQQEGKVFFGATVVIENDEHQHKTFRIVGPEEIYGDVKDYISIDSPMARALLKKEVGDEFIVNTPDGDKEWFVNSIVYTEK
jgi:transcription elongation factor GreB